MTASAASTARAPLTPLAAVVEEQGRRLVWIARHLDVDASTVSRWCSGERAIPDYRRDQLAAVLDVSPEDLLDPPPRRSGGATTRRRVA
jgi:plasmid maintenance system antidote protein VapI